MKPKRQDWQTPQGLALLRGWAREDLPMEEIARRCGFADPFYFSRRFRLENGETASAYRDRNRVGG